MESAISIVVPPAKPAASVVWSPKSARKVSLRHIVRQVVHIAAGRDLCKPDSRIGVHAGHANVRDGLTATCTHQPLICRRRGWQILGQYLITAVTRLQDPKVANCL